MRSPLLSIPTNPQIGSAYHFPRTFLGMGTLPTHHSRTDWRLLSDQLYRTCFLIPPLVRFRFHHLSIVLTRVYFGIRVGCFARSFRPLIRTWCSLIRSDHQIFAARQCAPITFLSFPFFNWCLYMMAQLSQLDVKRMTTCWNGDLSSTLYYFKKILFTALTIPKYSPSSCIRKISREDGIPYSSPKFYACCIWVYRSSLTPFDHSNTVQRNSLSSTPWCDQSIDAVPSKHTSNIDRYPYHRIFPHGRINFRKHCHKYVHLLHGT